MHVFVNFYYISLDTETYIINKLTASKKKKNATKTNTPDCTFKY